jgi:hypothetical protein
MNWSAVGAIGEILGAVGVIITLIYLRVRHARGRYLGLGEGAARVSGHLTARLPRRGLTDEANGETTGMRVPDGRKSSIPRPGRSRGRAL